MKYLIDIDGTICNTFAGDYKMSQPWHERIEKINKLYDEGHEIHYWTARGSVSGIDWTELTIKQLNEWGCKYTTIKTGKPAYDYWIDDKAMHSDVFFHDIK
jgi:hypothetical protein